jgi:hypothetical protein
MAFIGIDLNDDPVNVGHLEPLVANGPIHRLMKRIRVGICDFHALSGRPTDY